MPTRIVEALWLKKQNRWQIKVQANGIRRAFTSSIPGRAGKAEAHQKVDDWLASQTIDGSTPISVLWPKWVETITSADAITKANTFWGLYVSPVIGKKAISKVTEGDLQAILDRAAKKGLAWKSIANIRGTLAAFTKWVRLNRYAILSTEDLTISKSAPKGKKAILQPDDIVKLWNGKDSPYINLFKFAVLTGLRPGELIGMRWSDITDSRLFVQRAINYRGVITPGKNQNAQRMLWLGKYEMNVINAQRALLKKRGIISPWVFPKFDGDHAMQCAVAHSWEVFRKKNDITPGITPYGWRHTFVSINNNMPEGLKRRRVGHAASMDTEGIYGQAVAGEDEQAAAFVEQRFDAIFSASPKISS